MVERTDLVVVGSGAAGIEAALTASDLGATVALVSASDLGGTCVHTGCVPNNVLLHASAQHRALGGKGHGMDLAAVQNTVSRVVTRMSQNARRGLLGAGVRVFPGSAALDSGGLVRVRGADGQVDLHGESVILATGATTVLPPVAEVTDRRVLTSVAALGMSSVPHSAIVVVGGLLGLEWACLLRNAGAKVTVVEERATLRSVTDAEVAEYLATLLEADGITVLTDRAPVAVTPDADGVRLTLLGGAGQEHRVQADVVLFADFRRPATGELGLERTEVALAPDGAVVVDDALRAGAPSVYAPGDVNGGWMLAAEARAEGMVAAQNACGATEAVDRNLVPRAVHTTPEAAGVGRSEQEARAAGLDVVVGYGEYAGNARALALGLDQGVVKLVADARTEEILGAAIVGASATELVSLLSMAMRAESTVTELARSTHPHPSLAEVVVDAAKAVRHVAAKAGSS